LVAVVFSIFLCQATRAVADPIAIGGLLEGDVVLARPQQDLFLIFPTFGVRIQPDALLSPGFPIGASNGSALQFTQTSVFSGHSASLRGIIEADVTGTLSFAGATRLLNVSPILGSSTLTSPLQVSGFLHIAHGDDVLFDGSLTGSGTGLVTYEDRFGSGDLRLAGYLFRFDAVSATPEPASVLLVLSGVGWVVRKRRVGPNSSADYTCCDAVFVA
jgi:hypothetical protein